MPLRTTRKAQICLLLILLTLQLGGFLATSLISYHVARDNIRQNIVDTELPLTSDTIYSEIQKDLIRPTIISSMMSRDTFVRDWVMSGEQDVGQMTRYLREIQEHYAAFTSFFISEQTHVYYQAKGILKHVDQQSPRDTWYFRVRDMQEPYEINVDVDMANQDRLTFFINYKVFDYEHRFIGATGVGLTVDSVIKLIDDYQQRYERNVYFVDTNGNVVLTGSKGGPQGAHAGLALKEIQGLKSIQESLSHNHGGRFTYREQGRGHFLNVRFIPELNWYLFVDKHEESALAEARQTLYLNLITCLVVSFLVLVLVYLSMRRYHQHIEALATTDTLTELPNRRGFNMLATQALNEAKRDQLPLSALLIDLDHFKVLNDTHGHLAGDEVLRGFAQALQRDLRQSDIICRWGGEEFILLLKGNDAQEARHLAEKIRQSVEKARFAFNGTQLSITTSIGLSELRPSDNLDRLIGRADRALYRAKQSGRNRVCEDHTQ
ncbi:sensor domain-containing diguanylate cyclase [Pseudomonas sp. LRF_L74]|uniref:sensor domain-containing diguanylate cyclase n=1 Tax=Pseudomonas sp. LRF_L74 TaxID=3369422 RepID=UPI003F6249D1